MVGDTGIDAGADEQVLSFWRTFTNRFTWDFLPTEFLNAAEPLAAQLPHWTHDESNDAVYGLRRTKPGIVTH